MKVCAGACMNSNLIAHEGGILGASGSIFGVSVRFWGATTDIETVVCIVVS